MKTKKYIFNEGTTLLYYNQKENNGVAIYIIGNGGSAIIPYKPGIVHLGEHLRYLCTAKMDSDACREYIATNNLITNAYTSQGDIVFFIYNSKKRIEKDFDFYTDLITNNMVNNDNFEKEKKVVCQEILLGEDDKKNQIYYKFNDLLFKNKFYNIKPYGDEKSVLSYSQSDVQKCMDSIIGPKNIVVVIGNIEFCNAKKLVKNYFLKKVKNKNQSKISQFSRIFSLKPSKIDCFFNEKDNAVKIKFAIPFKFSFEYGTYDFLKEYECFKIITSKFCGFNGFFEKTLRAKYGYLYSYDVNLKSFRQDAFIAFEISTSKENLKSCIDLTADYLKKMEVDENYIKEQCRIQTLKDDITYAPTYKNLFRNIYDEYYENGVLYDKSKFKRTIYKISSMQVNQMIKKIKSSNKIYALLIGNIKLEEFYDIKTLKKIFFNK